MTLALGDKGDDVRELQRALVAAGFKLAVDGDLGPRTHAALLAYAERERIEWTHIVPEDVVAALLGETLVPSSRPPAATRARTEGLRLLAIAPAYNTGGKKDASGAFIPEASRFSPLGAYLFDNRASKAKRRVEVERFIRGDRGVNALAIFCHGYRTGLQTGHTVKTISGLAGAIAAVAKPTISVMLYSCDAARDDDADRADDQESGPGGDGGFADVFRDALVRRGLSGHVSSHTTVAHTTKNPYVRRFDISEQAAAKGGGEWIVGPGTPLWNAWRLALKGDLRLRFPLMSVAEIHAELTRAL